MDIAKQIAEYEIQLARLKSSAGYLNIQRLEGAIAALTQLKEAEAAEEKPADAEPAKAGRAQES